MCLVHGVLDAALRYFGLALQFAQRIDECNHDEYVHPQYVAECDINLAAVHTLLGYLEKAKERALAIRLKKLGPDHLDVATCYNSYSLVYFCQ